MKSIIDVSQRIYNLITSKGISYGELASMTGIPKSALHRYATGETAKIPPDRVGLIADALGVSAAYLLGWSEGESLLSPNVTEDSVTFPVIGEIAAGYDFPAAEDFSGETVDIPGSFLRGRAKEDFFVLRVHGDSMYPLYMDGDKVLILKQETLNRSGEIGAVLYDGNSATLKKVEYVTGEDWMLLLPLNPQYPPRRIEGAELENCRVIGIPKLLIREIS